MYIPHICGMNVDLSKQSTRPVQTRFRDCSKKIMVLIANNNLIAIIYKTIASKLWRIGVQTQGLSSRLLSKL